METPARRYGHVIARATIPAATLVALSLVSLLGVLWLAAGYQTRVAQAEQARLAENAVLMRGQQIERVAVDYGAWDEAVDHLVTRPDANWADENVGASTLKTYDLDMSFVVTPDDRASYANIKGARSDRPLAAVLSGGIAPLLDRQRAVGPAGSISGLVLADGRPAIAAVVPIRPQHGEPAADAPRDLLVFVDVIEADDVARIGRAFRLPELRLVPASGAAASVPLRTADGQGAAVLEWDGARPGDDLLRIAVPAWGLVALLFAALTALFARQTRAAARSIADSEHRATHDALTGLPNRALFFERLDGMSRALAKGGSAFAVAYLDLDGFKAVNDGFGHEAGDAVLREVGRRLQACLGPDDLAARLGGDEFAVLLPGYLQTRLALLFGRQAIVAIEEAISLADGRSVRISATVGVTFAPRDSVDPLVLLRNADRALYAGKRHGKGQVGFHTEVVAERLSA